MNARQKELAIVALELGATVWLSVDGDVCAAWMSGDSTAGRFFDDIGVDNCTFQQLSIGGTDNDVVTF